MGRFLMKGNYPEIILYNQIFATFTSCLLPVACCLLPVACCLLPVAY